MKNKKETCIFLHIPKCAGSSFNRVLEGNFSFTEVFYYRPPYGEQLDALKTLTPYARNGLRLISGHLSYGVHEWIDGPCAYITLLRDPIDRVVSLYDFIREDPHHPLNDTVCNMSLQEFSAGSISPQITNCMTRQISGNPKVDFLVGTDLCSEDDLIRAKEHLRSFKFIGMQNDFYNSMLLCRVLFGWKIPQQPRLNKTTHRTRVDDLDERTVQALREHNSMDLKLYQYGLELYQNQLQEKHRELRRLKMLTPFSKAGMAVSRRLGELSRFKRAVL